MKSRVRCEKQTLVRVQSRKYVKRVQGHVLRVPAHVKTMSGHVFQKCSKIHKWCQETFRNSQKQCRVLGTMFGWGVETVLTVDISLAVHSIAHSDLPNLALRIKSLLIILNRFFVVENVKQTWNPGFGVKNKPWLGSKVVNMSNVSRDTFYVSRHT